MLRRALLLVTAIACFAADPARDAAAVITEITAALTARNTQEFLDAFDRKMPEYENLATNIAALAAEGETQSYAEITRNEGDDRTRTLVVSWDLRIQRDVDPVATRRTAEVTCKLEKQGKRWKVVGFAPVDFLAP